MPQISPAKLTDLVIKTLQAAGSDAHEAAIVADHLVRANLAGHDSHGVGMLSNYLPGIQSGLLRVNQAATTTLDSGALLGVDGHRGFGQRIARETIQRGIERAVEHGVALIGLRQCHHIGRIGTYAEQCMDAGMISLHFVNVTDHQPMVAAFRGKQAVFGTNPICFGMPAMGDTRSVLLDMATSQIALGKTRVAYLGGKTVPQGAVIDHDGNLSDQPSVMWQEPKGALTPLADHKGYALCLMCEILAGVMTGGGSLAPHHERRGGIINNMMSIIIDPSRLASADYLALEMRELVAHVTGSAAAGTEPVILPGDPERQCTAERSAGLEFDDGNWASLVEAGALVGVNWNA
ncbi:malate/lactate/ureidoglycolate dehydrogenase [Litorivicinus lipolyticus]|uniref:Malate/lactate/ureidoglycolate dehydrogenase n=1 Tax=Litorivicinus lipolyticus TaxID=418701 RepID=A0A5Q2QCC8_9GAMM|nr:malate/lactate/ureidoglycolate dehydrogenase [Litorivicinus lipolyticus]QGG79666.1 malate/lactate/ureidoglycolate dehydrogenase [Litorivicinus lipolyticus]